MINDIAQSHDTFYGINNIIFDLGGVLYNVDYALVEKEFETLHNPSFHKNIIENSTGNIIYTRQTQPEIFTQYEIGAITTVEFYEGLRRDIKLEGTDEELEKAWNSMLLGVYPGRNSLVWRLKQRFRLALLSNTNELHIEHVKPECQELFSFFDKLFYSYQMGLRKPDTAIFQAVLETMGYAPAETLFIDDSHQHIEAARACGLRTLWLQHPDSLELIVEMLLPPTMEKAETNE